jgi:hypothetical protein
MRAANIPIAYTEPAEVAAAVVDGIRNDTFWIHPENPRSDELLRARTESIIARRNPDYLKPTPG